MVEQSVEGDLHEGRLKTVTTPETTQKVHDIIYLRK